MKPRILVIDDSLTARMKVKEILDSDGMEAILARSPEEGTKLALEQNPDVIVLDVILPGIDGIELCSQWRSMPELASTPVLLMSGERADRDDRAAGLRAGALGYVVKPFNKNELLAQVNLLYRLGQTHKSLEQAAAIAQSANESKSRFLANMSHEIRTPLTAILGFSETILDTSLDGNDRERAVQTVLRNGQHMLQVLNDILALSKIEADKLELELDQWSPFRLIDDVLDLMSLKAREKALALSVDYRFPLPSVIETDSTRLKQILVNLIGNSIKFTESGHVKLTVELDQASALLVFHVEDSGIGMTEEQTSRLFRPFSQADASTVRRFGGTGLGLALSRELTQRLGGTVSVRSTMGVGTVFTASISSGSAPTPLVDNIPQRPIASAPDRPARLTKLSGHVLVVEDGADIRALITHFLKKRSVSYVEAENGQTGLDRASEEDFDLVLTDMQMPVMDGYTVARELRARGYQGPIVALTGNVMKHEVEQMFTSGCTDYISKPFTQTRLFEILDLHLEADESADAALRTGASCSAASQSDAKSGNAAEPLTCSLDDEDEELLGIVLKFVDSLDRRMNGLQQALSERNWEDIRSLAHQLINATAFGYEPLSETARTLEHAAISEDGTTSESALSELAALCHRVRTGRDDLVRRKELAR